MCYVIYNFMFFFKQKTAYEMRISDWSSDVCSSDLLRIDGDVKMDAASVVNVELGGAPSDALFDVGGDLALNGTLNVSDQGGFGLGVYRLFDYDGDRKSVV